MKGVMRVNMQVDECRVYCPYCGKSLMRMFNGVAELECPKCKSVLKIIVTDEEYTIFGVIDKAS